jgi:hypothetical protein
MRRIRIPRYFVSSRQWKAARIRRSVQRVRTSSNGIIGSTRASPERSLAARLHRLVVWQSLERFLAVPMRVASLRLNEYAFHFRMGTVDARPS